MLQILTDTNWTHSKWHKCLNVVPKLRNFAKSGHTEPKSQLKIKKLEERKAFKSDSVSTDATTTTTTGRGREAKNGGIWMGGGRLEIVTKAVNDAKSISFLD